MSGNPRSTQQRQTHKAFYPTLSMRDYRPDEQQVMEALGKAPITQGGVSDHHAGLSARTRKPG